MSKMNQEINKLKGEKKRTIIFKDTLTNVNIAQVETKKSQSKATNQIQDTRKATRPKKC